MCKCRVLEHLGNSYYKCMKCDRIFDKSTLQKPDDKGVWEHMANVWATPPIGVTYEEEEED